jgi:hypothetical protein
MLARRDGHKVGATQTASAECSENRVPEEFRWLRENGVVERRSCEKREVFDTNVRLVIRSGMTSSDPLELNRWLQLME